jgi:hypothetical protein
MKDKEQEAKQLIIDYKYTFGSEQSKRVLEDLRKLANLNRSVIPRDREGRIDPLEVMRNEGQRSVVVHIYTKIAKNPNEVKQKEARS